MSDIEDRADAYERRLAQAGSTDDIVSSLVKAAADSQRYIRLLTISLIIDILLSIAMAGLAVVAWSNANHIAANTRDLKVGVHDICTASNTAAMGTNDVLQSLINAVTITNSLPALEKQDRIAKYKAAMVPMLRCAP